MPISASPMRYLSSISLALIVLMALACTATPAPTPTPSGPMYSEAEAMAILKEHLQTKIFPGEPYPCLLVIEGRIRNPSNYWVASYDTDGRLWNITVKSREPSIPSPTMDAAALVESLFKNPVPHPKQPRTKYYTWSVYERTGSIVATGDDPVNRMC